MSRAKFVAQVSLLIATGVTLRMVKHLLVGPLQFVNLPLSMTMIAGYLAGSVAGLSVGIITFILSDLLLGFGLWTIYNSLVSGAIGFLWGLLREVRCWTVLFVLSYISTLVYDIITSIVFYLTFMSTSDLHLVLTIALLGLFVPVAGGSFYAIGPVTEALTAFLTSVIAKRVKQALGG